MIASAIELVINARWRGSERHTLRVVSTGTRVIEEHGAAEYDTAIGLTRLCSGRLHYQLHQTIESSRTANAETAALVSSKHLMTSNW